MDRQGLGKIEQHDAGMEQIVGQVHGADRLEPGAVPGLKAHLVLQVHPSRHIEEDGQRHGVGRAVKAEVHGPGVLLQPLQGGEGQVLHIFHILQADRTAVVLRRQTLDRETPVIGPGARRSL